MASYDGDSDTVEAVLQAALAATQSQGQQAQQVQLQQLLSATDKAYRTALHRAVSRGHLDTARVIIRFDAISKGLPEDFYTQLWSAAVAADAAGTMTTLLLQYQTATGRFILSHSLWSESDNVAIVVQDFIAAAARGSLHSDYGQQLRTGTRPQAPSVVLSSSNCEVANWQFEVGLICAVLGAYVNLALCLLQAITEMARDKQEQLWQELIEADHQVTKREVKQLKKQLAHTDLLQRQKLEKQQRNLERQKKQKGKQGTVQAAVHSDDVAQTEDAAPGKQQLNPGRPRADAASSASSLLLNSSAASSKTAHHDNGRGSGRGNGSITPSASGTLSSGSLSAGAKDTPAADHPNASAFEAEPTSAAAAGPVQSLLQLHKQQQQQRLKARQSSSGNSGSSSSGARPSAAYGAAAAAAAAAAASPPPAAAAGQSQPQQHEKQQQQQQQTVLQALHGSSSSSGGDGSSDDSSSGSTTSSSGSCSSRKHRPSSTSTAAVGTSTPAAEAAASALAVPHVAHTTAQQQHQQQARQHGQLSDAFLPPHMRSRTSVVSQQIQQQQQQHTVQQQQQEEGVNAQSSRPRHQRRVRAHGDSECIVCLDRSVGVLLLPCRCMKLCAACCVDLQSHGSNACPWCQTCIVGYNVLGPYVAWEGRPLP